MATANPEVTLGVSETDSSENATSTVSALLGDGRRNSTPILLQLWNIFPANFAVPINGYISPILVLLTVVNNTMVVVVLLKRNMRSPTNSVLVGMALSDMFTGLIPVPVFIYFYGMDNYRDYMPFSWCMPFKIFSEIFPTVFHTASIWLTVALAVQRYIYICHSFRARTWCTIPNVIRGTVIVYVIAILCHVMHIFDQVYVPVVVESEVDPNVTILTCSVKYSAWAEILYFNFYFWFRIIFIHLVPCTSLVVLNALLIFAMKRAQKRRKQLLKQNKKSESKKIKESNCTTLMLVAVVSLFLLVEFPLGIIMILSTVDNTFNLEMIEPFTYSKMTLLSNLFILLSYPLNFFIYCGMSKQFRETFKRLFLGGPLPLDRECSQYTTLPTENGKTATTGAETAL